MSVSIASGERRDGDAERRHTTNLYLDGELIASNTVKRIPDILNLTQ